MWVNASVTRFFDANGFFVAFLMPHMKSVKAFNHITLLIVFGLGGESLCGKSFISNYCSTKVRRLNAAVNKKWKLIIDETCSLIEAICSSLKDYSTLSRKSNQGKPVDRPSDAEKQSVLIHGNGIKLNLTAAYQAKYARI